MLMLALPDRVRAPPAVLSRTLIDWMIALKDPTFPLAIAVPSMSLTGEPPRVTRYEPLSAGVQEPPGAIWYVIVND